MPFSEDNKGYRNLVMVFVTMVVLTIGNIIYTYVASERAANETGLKFCAVIIPVNQAYEAEDPSTDLGKLLKERYRRLAIDLNCKDEIEGR